MTLPYQRTHAVINARNFLRDLLDPTQTPRVSRAIRHRACDILKHFPNEYDMRHHREAFETLPLGGGHDYTSPLDAPKRKCRTRGCKRNSGHMGAHLV